MSHYTHTTEARTRTRTLRLHRVLHSPLAADLHTLARRARHACQDVCSHPVVQAGAAATLIPATMAALVIAAAALG